MRCWASRFGSSDQTPASCVPPKQDTVATREHVEIVRKSTVGNLGLRQQDGQLALDRDEFFIAEERFRSESRAIHDDALRESLELCQLANLAHLDLTAGNPEILQHRRKVRVGLDQHGVELTHPRIREWIFRRRKIVHFGQKVSNWAVERKQCARRYGVPAHHVVRHPADSVARADHQLIAAVCDVRSLDESWQEARRLLAMMVDGHGHHCAPAMLDVVSGGSALV